jgi:hypothetical protein
MGSAEQDHPDRDHLAAFVAGRLSVSERQTIEAHLESCDTCLDVLAGVPPDSALVILQEVAAGAAAGPHAATEPLALAAGLLDHPRYRIVELIGEGGMGAVYRAEHLLMRRPVALKIIRRELVERPDAVGRFRREVEAAARLAHPNIVTAFDADRVGDTHFLVMEFIDGIDLARFVRDRGPLPIAEATAYVVQAALALQHAHEHGMVHRDIKPQNLMRTTKGQVKVLDFGLAHLRGGVTVPEMPSGHDAGPRAPDAENGATSSSDGLRSESLTDPGVVLGSVDYLAPEQATDPHSADIRADIYGLGCTLYYLLAGAPPFAGGSAHDRLAAHAREMPRPLNELRSDLPAALDRVLARMIAKNRADRFQSPADVVQALEPFARAEASTPATASRRARAALFRPSGLRIKLAAALLLAAAFASGVGIYRIATDRGTLIIETRVADVRVAIKKGGDEVLIIDPKTKSRIRLRSGTYEVTPAGDAVGLRVSTDRFTLHRGSEEVVRVWREPVHRDRALVMDANATTGWFDFHRGNHEWARMTVVGDELQYMGKLRGGWVAKPQDALSNRAWDDFVFDAEFRLLAGRGGWALRFNEIEGKQGAFFHVRADGRVGLEAGFGDQVEWLIPWTQAATMHPAPQFNRVRLECIRRHFRIHVNDQLVAESADARYTPSPLHIYVICEEPPTDLRFRRIRVWRVSDETAGNRSKTP